MLRQSFLSFLVLVGLNGAVVSAQPGAAQPGTSSVDPAFLKGLRYRLVGPSRGGRVTTVTGVPSQPKTFYMGVASGGLFRTTDAGATWVSITDGKVPLGSTGCVAVADSDPNVIYLGTGSEPFEHNMRVRELVNSVNQLATRVREAQTKLRSPSGTAQEIDLAIGKLNRINRVAAMLFTEPVRYGKPGLQAHITYPAGMTANVDQKIGRDAIERYETLRKELEAIRAEVDRVLGPAQPVAAGNGLVAR
ncbi:MAG TPA: hypothetical protein VLQ90_08320 [Pyrinomonadaceae bacterium]|nr:hypothetical protein [Pyrinomonadaceae bacterium]